MKREFLINIIFLIAINALIKPFYIFGIDRSVQNAVGEHTYGVYYAMWSFSFMFQIVCDLGIQNYNTREIARHRHLLDKYMARVLSLKLILSAAYLVVTFVIGFFVYRGENTMLLFILCLNQILTSLVFYLRSNIAGLGFYRTDSILSAMDRLLLIVIVGSILVVPAWREQLTILRFATIQILSLAITAIITFIIIFRKTTRFKLQFNKLHTRIILKEALPYALAVFLMTLYTRPDAVLLERMLPDGAKQTGIYASAYRLLDALNMLGFLFAGLLLPMLSNLIKKKESPLPLVRLSLEIILCCAITAASALIIHRYEIMPFLYREATNYSGDVLALLITSFIALSCSYILSTYLIALGNLKRANKIYAIAIPLSIISNLILIPHYKAFGAATSTLITQFFVVSILYLEARKHLQPTQQLQWWLRFFLFTVLCFGVQYELTIYFSSIKFWWLMIAGSIVSCSFAYLTGFIRLKEIKKTIG